MDRVDRADMGPAWSLRWRAPELALVLGERTVTSARQAGDELGRLRADTAVVFASSRLGQKLAVAERAMAALRAADRLGDVSSAAVLRLELAGCARSVGVPLIGAALLGPLLAGDSGTPGQRAAALVRLVGCLAYRAEPRVLDAGLARADQLYLDDRDLGPDTVVLVRALLRSAAAAEHRRRGDARSAVDAAREGADLLRELARPDLDSGYARSRLAAQLALGLLDLGRLDDARLVADALFAESTRGAAAGPTGWLALALAARVYLPAGLLTPAMAVLREGVALGSRHRLDALHAEALGLLADASERAGQLSEAIGLLRTAHGLRMRHVRAENAVRGELIGTFGMPARPDELVGVLASFAPAARPRRSDPSPGPTAPDLVGRRRLDMPVAPVAPIPAQSPAAVSSPRNSDVALVLVDVASDRQPTGELVLDRVADRVRHAAPADATVARVGGAELAVLLPGVPRGQAERWVERLRDVMNGVDWPGVTVTVRTTAERFSTVSASTVSASTVSASAVPAQPVPAASRVRASAVPASAGPAQPVSEPSPPPARHSPDNFTTTVMPVVPADPPPPVPVSVVAPGIPRPPLPEASYYSLARQAVEPTASDARSMLSRLGVEVRGSGGRRRAADPAESELPATDLPAAGLPAAPPVADPPPAAPPVAAPLSARADPPPLPPRQPISLPSMDWLSELSLGPRPVLPEPPRFDTPPDEPRQYEPPLYEPPRFDAPPDEPRAPVEPRESAPVPPPSALPPLPSLAPPPIMPSQPLFHFDPEPTPQPRAPESNGVGGKHSNRLGDLLMEALLAYRTASEPEPEPVPEPAPEPPRHSAIARELDDDRDTTPRWLLPRWDS